MTWRSAYCDADTKAVGLKQNESEDVSVCVLVSVCERVAVISFLISHFFGSVPHARPPHPQRFCFELRLYERGAHAAET